MQCSAEPVWPATVSIVARRKADRAGRLAALSRIFGFLWGVFQDAGLEAMLETYRGSQGGRRRMFK